MENFNFEHNLRRQDYLPQTEDEWIETGKFDIENININGKEIRCALTRVENGETLVTMAGGIPRDPERRKKLPLINKLYGHLALKLLDINKSSLLYNQPATGGSGGDWENENITTRTNTLIEISEHFFKDTQSSDLSLIGTSAAAYMVVNAIKYLQDSHINISKIVLISPAAFPKNVENIPYGDSFSNIIRKSWNIEESPVFSKIEDYVKGGGKVFITFFENDDPPIPKYIQDYYKSFAQRLSNEGGLISVNIIPSVGHNFRRIGELENKNVVDNNSIRETAKNLLDFLKK